MDPRIARTRTSMQDALLELCRDADFHSVSVSDIAGRAGINRSTFYQHYPDKETLLADALDRFAEQAAAHMEADLHNDEADPRDIIHRFLVHVRENATLYRTMLSSNGSPVLVDRLHERVMRLTQVGLTTKTKGELGMPVNIAAASVAGSFIGILREWLSMKPLPSAERATEWAWHAVTTPLGHEVANV